MARIRRSPPGRLKGQVIIRLIDGRRVYATPKTLESYMRFNIPLTAGPTIGEPDSKPVWCKRTDVEEFREMTAKEIVEDGLVRKDPFKP